jgi:pyruvate, orthophosphate dikinase
MQDIEFTIERGKLYMLQTRTGKRTGAAAVKIACDMVKEKLIDEKRRCAHPRRPDQLLLPSFDPKARARDVLATKGLPASPGAAVGKLAFTADEAVERTHAGEKVILVRKETSPEDIDGMHSAAGHPHQHRRHDQPRGRRRPRLGQVLRRRRRRDPHRREGRKFTVGGKTFGRRRRDLHRRLDRRGHRREVPTSSPSSPATSPPS